MQCAPVPAMDSYPSSHWQVRPRQRALSPHVSLDVHDKGPVLHVSISSCFFVGHMHLGANQVNMRGLCELLEHNASVISVFFDAAHTVRLRTLPVRRLCTCTLRHCSSHCSGKSWLWEGGGSQSKNHREHRHTQTRRNILTDILTDRQAHTHTDTHTLSLKKCFVQ